MDSSVRSVLVRVMFSPFLSKAYTHTFHSLGIPTWKFQFLKGKLLRGDVPTCTAVAVPSLRDVREVTAVLLDRETILSQGRFNVAQNSWGLTRSGEKLQKAF
jgi:hypothetical protein